MENLYIKIQNGQPIDHPALESNLLKTFGSIPLNWEFFVRKQIPPLGDFEKFQKVANPYVKENEVWTDFWQIVEMSLEEKETKQKMMDEAIATMREKILLPIGVTTI